MYVVSMTDTIKISTKIDASNVIAKIKDYVKVC